MNCPKCYADNRETRKFCGQCGAKLVLVCPQCGFENLPEEKFCGECGQDLKAAAKPVPKDLSFDEKLAKIQRYLPKGLTEKILSQRDRIEGERKQVTVTFCDMERYTALSEKLGSEGLCTKNGESYKRQGDRIKAQENFGKAIDILRDCGAHSWVEKYERELASMA